MKKAVALLLVFVFAFAPYPTAFAVDSELPPDPRIEVVEVNSAEEIPEEESEIPVIPEEPVIPNEPETDEEIPDEPDRNEIVASASICSSMSVPLIA